MSNDDKFADLRMLLLREVRIEGLRFDFAANEVKIRVSSYNETDYDYYDLAFSGVTKVSIVNFSVDDFVGIEVSSYLLTTGDRSSINFVLQLGYAIESARLAFEFEEFEVVTI